MGDRNLGEKVGRLLEAVLQLRRSRDDRATGKKMLEEVFTVADCLRDVRTHVRRLERNERRAECAHDMIRHYYGGVVGEHKATEARCIRCDWTWKIAKGDQLPPETARH